MSWSGRKVAQARSEVVAEYGNQCVKCGKLIDLTKVWPDPASLSIGHQLPRSRGGSDHLENLRPEHLACNLKAGNRPISQPARQASISPGWMDWLR